MDSPHNKPLLTVPAKGVAIHTRMVALLKELIVLKSDNCLAPSFRVPFSSCLKLFDQYQAAILEHNQMTVTCRSGCCCCCNHWVEDVNSFEAAIIYDYILKNIPERIPEIIKTCEKDLQQLEHLEKTMLSHPDVSQTPDDQLDQTDLLLAVFYQFKRPCPLLDNNGRCSIYPVRPITCRIYFSFSDPSRCEPEYINEDDIPTYLLDTQEEVSELLDTLHFKYLSFEGNTGLRSLLLSYLRQSD
ncbi:MAG: YkgJ family cysteine cluster protein [Chitinispirillaceae bacterium]|nr:YkgJ family cysteine cluster protein [Chitinispirillaceae bacterium]